MECKVHFQKRKQEKEKSMVKIRFLYILDSRLAN